MNDEIRLRLLYSKLSFCSNPMILFCSLFINLDDFTLSKDDLLIISSWDSEDAVSTAPKEHVICKNVRFIKHNSCPGENFLDVPKGVFCINGRVDAYLSFVTKVIGFN